MTRKLALLISNNQYADTNLSKLAAPLADAAALAHVLRDPASGAFDEVQTLVNQPSAEIRHAIADFFHGKQPSDLLLLYFSGHGLLDERSRLYLATADTDVKLPRARSLEAAYIAQEMDDSRSKRQLLLLDCCHSGAFRQGITKSTINQPVQTSTIFDGDGRVVLAASDATQYAFEGDKLVGEGVRSVFTHYLVEGLAGLRADANGDGVITVDELYEYLYPRVTAHTPTQTPVKWNYHQRGIFVIAGSGATATHSTPAVATASTPKSPSYRTWVVDPMHRGDFTTIGEAIAAAKSGDKIVIRPGIYDEGLVIDKPLELEGEGDVNDVIVQAVGKHAILFEASIGQVRNLTLRQNGGGNWFCVDIAQGRLLLEGCDISSQSKASVAIHNGANPIVRNNRIHDGKKGGIHIYEYGQGVIEANDIFTNTNPGIEIESGSNPNVRNNRIHDGKSAGIYVYKQGQGVIEENEIFANALTGIGIKDCSAPTVRNNRIRDGKQNGILVHAQGQGVIEENDIFANDAAGIEIRSGGNPTVRNNHIHDGKSDGIYVYEQGQGVIEDNDIFANTNSGIAITNGGNPTVCNNRIHNNKFNGILVHEQSQGVIEENDIFANDYSGIEIKSASNPMVCNNRIHDDLVGIYVYRQGQGVIEGNDIFANAHSGILITSGGNPKVRSNHIYGNTFQAIQVFQEGGGRFDTNDLRNNKRGAWDISEDSLPNVTRKDNIET